MSIFELLALKIELARAKRAAREVERVYGDTQAAFADLEAAEQRLRDYIARQQKENEQERNGDG